MTATASKAKTSGARQNFIIPPPDNVHRPVFLFMLIVALGFLIGFGYLMYTPGSSKGAFISILLVITAVFTPVLWLTVLQARAEVPKLKKFKESGYWASWTLSPEEYRKYVSSERGAIAAKLVRPLLPVVVVGAYFIMTGDKEVGVIMILADLALMVLAVTIFGPPRIPHDTVCEVHINGYGMLVAGRFTPFRGGYPRLRRVDFQHGDPAVLTFVISWAGSGPAPMRVPVPQGHWDDAQKLAHHINVRFRAIKT